MRRYGVTVGLCLAACWPRPAAAQEPLDGGQGTVAQPLAGSQDGGPPNASPAPAVAQEPGSATAAEKAASPAAPETVSAEPGHDVMVLGRRERTTGTSESVLSRQTIASLPGGDTQPLAYVLATQPGFVADTFGFGLHVRGADGGLLYVIDGIPLLAAPLGEWGATMGFIPTRLVQNVRVLTGGFPAEFGSGLGAVIDITTRHALGGPSAEAQVAYGSYGTTDYALDYAQEIGKLSLFAAGNFQNTKRGFDPPSVTPILHDDMTSGNAFVRLDYRLRETDHIEFIASFNQSRFQIPIDPTLLPLSDAPKGAVRGADAYDNDPPPFVPYDANPIENERNVFAAVSYRHVGAGGTLQIAPFVREAYGSLTCDPARSLGKAADPGSACSDVRRDVLHAGGLADFTWVQGQTHVWKTGLLLDAARSNVDYTAYFRDDAVPVAGADAARTLAGSDSTNGLIAGVFLQDKILLGKLNILAGARLDIERASFLHSDEPSLFLLGPSARLGLSYAVTTNLTLHGFAGYLWQPPSTIDAPVAGRILVPSLAGQNLPVDIKAEKDWSAELGLTERLLPGLTLDITGWGRIARDQLDRVNVGTTNLVASYNFERGRAAGAEASCRLSGGDNVDGFANLGWQLAQGSGISSERFLFSPQEVADKSWVMLDHVQTWTANLGIDLHDAPASTHVSALLNYGSGMRTGADSDKTVPSHVIVDLTIRRRFDIFSGVSSHLHPEIAVDVLNLFDQIYAYRIGTGYIGSAYGPPRRVFVRLSVPFS